MCTCSVHECERESDRQAVKNGWVREDRYFEQRRESREKVLMEVRQKRKEKQRRDEKKQRKQGDATLLE